jgi:hypothetical protein
MAIRFFCPAGHEIVADDSLAGKPVDCPQCQATVFAPIAAPPTPAPQVTPSPAVAAPQTPAPPTPAPAAKPHPRRGVPLAALLGAEDTLAPPAHKPKKPVAPLPTQAFADMGAVARPSPGPPAAEPRSPVVAMGRRRSSSVPHAEFLRLVVGLALVAAVNLLPVVWLGQWALGSAPGWARAAMAAAAIQAAYVAWSLAAPDWASIRVLTVVFAVSAALYGMVAAIALATPLSQAVSLGLNDLRMGAAAWCGALALLMAAAAWFASRFAGRWRRATYSSRSA